MRLRDDVPDEFAAEPAAFDVAVPGRRQASITYRFVPKKRGTYVFEQVDALVASRLGFWRGQYSLAAADRGAGLSRYSPGRAVHDAGTPRPAEYDGTAAIAPAGNR